MTKESAGEPKVITQEDEGAMVEVVRDSTFARINADACFPFFYGRDLELSLLIVSASVDMPQSFGEASRPAGAVLSRNTVAVKSQYVETARVRMSPAAALSVSMNILQALLDSAQIEEDTLRTQIDAVISMSASEAEATH